MRRPVAAAPERLPLVAAVDALTVDELEDDEVARYGIARAVLTLVRRTVVATGGYPSDPAAKHAAIHETTARVRRLCADALDVWDEAPGDVETA